MQIRESLAHWTARERGNKCYQCFFLFVCVFCSRYKLFPFLEVKLISIRHPHQGKSLLHRREGNVLTRTTNVLFVPCVGDFFSFPSPPFIFSKGGSSWGGGGGKSATCCSPNTNYSCFLEVTQEKEHESHEWHPPRALETCGV